MRKLFFFITFTAATMSVTSCFLSKSRPWDQDYYSYTDGFCLDGKEFHRNESKWDSKRTLFGNSRDSLYYFRYKAILSDSRDYRAEEKHLIIIEAIFDSLSFIDGYTYTSLAEDEFHYVLSEPFMDIENGRRNTLLPYIGVLITPFHITGGWVSFWLDHSPIDVVYPATSQYRINRIAYEFEAEDDNGMIHHITDGYVKAE